MPDYGHTLSFGTFLTPSADRPQQVLDLAVATEQAGLDLVTVQDHPYNPGFLDTWTLLSVIAAHTERVHVVPNVANLPLRPPVVLARSAASLDLLSGGRVELGLGAGAFWDPIVANGGPRRTPGAAVDALADAIGIIRATWDTSGRSVTSSSEHHQVKGARPGPAPAHPVGIWLGAYKPRMLRLTGAQADGWLPSAGYAEPGALAGMNTVIDDAARAAGRDPAAITRLYNLGPGTFPQGHPSTWAEQLAELALTDGISGFVLPAGDAGEIAAFAEVAALTRELVDAERASGPRTAGRSDTSTAPDNETGTGATTTTAPGSAVTGAPAAATSPTAGFPVVPTPDDGRRRSDVRVWDESTRPTGPAPEPGRTYSAHDVSTGQHLVDIHNHLRSELAQVEDLVEQVARGITTVGAARSAINTMTMRQNSWTLGTYCESYCRVVTTHHTIEDQSMFPHLAAADPGLAPVIDRLAEEHLAIHDVLEGVDKALVALVGAEDQRAGIDGLRDAMDLLADTLLSHLSYEERELVEPLARLGMHGAL